MNEKVVNLTAHSMQNNIMVSGLAGYKKGENFKQSALSFLQDKMNLPMNMNDILVAHRVGRPLPEKDRLMIIRGTPDLKGKILENVKVLKGVKNEKGQFYYVNKQLPEALAKKERDIRFQIEQLKQKEEGLANDRKMKIEVRSCTLYLNGQPVRKQLTPPESTELFPEKSKKQINKLKFHASDTFGEKGSQFIAFANRVNNMGNVR